MATEFSMTGIMNAALVSQGMDEINDSQSLPEHRVLSRNWPLIIEAELEDGAYHFTKQEVTLNNRTDGRFGFDDAYLLPGDCLHVRRVKLETLSGIRLDPPWVQDDSHVHLDSVDGPIVEYVVVPDVHLWSANFARGVQMKLEAVLLRAVKEEAGEAAQMEQMAEAQFQRARTNSSKARSVVETSKPSALAEARFRRGSS